MTDLTTINELAKAEKKHPAKTELFLGVGAGEVSRTDALTGIADDAYTRFRQVFFSPVLTRTLAFYSPTRRRYGREIAELWGKGPGRTS